MSPTRIIKVTILVVAIIRSVIRVHVTYNNRRRMLYVHLSDNFENRIFRALDPLRTR